MKKLLAKWFVREKELCPEELVKPFFVRAKQAILLDELPKAIAHLDRGITIAPDHLKLYLHRAQIFQYGLQNYSRALRDYRFILRALEKRPNEVLAEKCREAMKDMMNP
jgi:tetratricopeptide (TPR) repeat protein